MAVMNSYSIRDGEASLLGKEDFLPDIGALLSSMVSFQGHLKVTS